MSVSSEDNFYIKSGYRARAEQHYFDDRQHTDVVHQPDAYALAAFIASRYGADTIIDVGCGSARKLMALDGFRKIGIDFGINYDHCRASFPSETWLEADLELTDALAIDDAVVNRSVVICADVIEHLVDPTNLLTLLCNLSRQARAVIITTPERDLVRGAGDLGPPVNPSHIREWNLAELGRLLDRRGLQPTFIGLTVNNDRSLEKKTILAVIDSTARQAIGRAPADFRPLALVATFNEADIVIETVRKLLNDGFDVHILDNWSDDGGYEAALALGGEVSGLSVERFPAGGPPSYFEWQAILQRKDEIALLHPGRWVVHADCDEIRCSPWSGISFRHGLWIADQMGFNAVDFTVCDFRPIGDEFTLGASLEQTLTRFEFGKRSGHFTQVKAWRQGTNSVALAKSGGHQADFSGRRVFPYKFMLKHYPLRNPEQARRKIFTERLARFSPHERELGWHIHYDHWKLDDEFHWPRGMIEFDEDATRRDYLVELISGIGILR